MKLTRYSQHLRKHDASAPVPPQAEAIVHHPPGAPKAPALPPALAPFFVPHHLFADGRGFEIGAADAMAEDDIASVEIEENLTVLEPSF